MRELQLPLVVIAGGTSIFISMGWLYHIQNLIRAYLF